MISLGWSLKTVTSVYGIFQGSSMVLERSSLQEVLERSSNYNSNLLQWK